MSVQHIRCAGAGAPPPAVDLGQRLVVLRCLEAQCGDGQLLVDLFVNYDCDLEGANLFERMVAALVRIAQTPPSLDAHAQVLDDERALRVLVSRAAVSLCCVPLLLCLFNMPPSQLAQILVSRLSACCIAHVCS